MISTAEALVRFHEGCSLVAKPDAKGKWALGYGHDVPPPGQPGHVATCTQAQADAWLVQDLATATTAAIRDVGTAVWAELDDVRRAVLIDMAYELGGAGLAGFEDMITALQTQDWPEVKHQALNSKWAKHDVPSRAAMDAEMLFTGAWPTIH